MKTEQAAVVALPAVTGCPQHGQARTRAARRPHPGSKPRGHFRSPTMQSGESTASSPLWGIMEAEGGSSPSNLDFADDEHLDFAARTPLCHSAPMPPCLSLACSPSLFSLLLFPFPLSLSLHLFVSPLSLSLALPACPSLLPASQPASQSASQWASQDDNDPTWSRREAARMRQIMIGKALQRTAKRESVLEGSGNVHHMGVFQCVCTFSRGRLEVPGETCHAHRARAPSNERARKARGRSKGSAERGDPCLRSAGAESTQAACSLQARPEYRRYVVDVPPEQREPARPLTSPALADWCDDGRCAVANLLRSASVRLGLERGSNATTVTIRPLSISSMLLLLPVC